MARIAIGAKKLSRKNIIDYSMAGFSQKVVLVALWYKVYTGYTKFYTVTLFLLQLLYLRALLFLRGRTCCKIRRSVESST